MFSAPLFSPPDIFFFFLRRCFAFAIFFPLIYADAWLLSFFVYATPLITAYFALFHCSFLSLFSFFAPRFFSRDFFDASSSLLPCASHAARQRHAARQCRHMFSCRHFSLRRYATRLILPLFYAMLPLYAMLVVNIYVVARAPY